MRRKIISEEELLRIAMDIIKEEDLESCTVRSIASRAGIAVGTLYNYFPSHEELLQKVFRRSWQGTLERLSVFTGELQMIGKVIFSVKGIFVQNGCLRKKAVQNVICIPNKTQIRHEKWEKV